MSGSNCCDLRRIHLFLRRADGAFAERAEVRLAEPKQDLPLIGGLARPHLVDWGRGGYADLMIGYCGAWTLWAGMGPLADKNDLTLIPVKLPPLQGAWPMHLSLSEMKLPPARGAWPIHFSFADWDGDGRVDLLVGVQWEGPPRYSPDGIYSWRPERFSVYWFRNTSDTRPPTFAAAAPLLDVPFPWQLHALTTVALGGDGRPSLVVSVSKGWNGEQLRPEAGELWLYRRKAERSASPDRSGK